MEFSFDFIAIVSIGIFSLAAGLYISFREDHQQFLPYMFLALVCALFAMILPGFGLTLNSEQGLLTMAVMPVFSIVFSFLGMRKAQCASPLEAVEQEAVAEPIKAKSTPKPKPEPEINAIEIDDEDFGNETAFDLDEDNPMFGDEVLLDLQTELDQIENLNDDLNGLEETKA